MSRIRKILEEIQNPKVLKEATMKPEEFLKTLKAIFAQFDLVQKEVKKADALLKKIGADYQLSYVIDFDDNLDIPHALIDAYEEVYDSLEDDEKAQEKFYDACEPFLPI